MIHGTRIDVSEREKKVVDHHHHHFGMNCEVADLFSNKFIR